MTEAAHRSAQRDSAAREWRTGARSHRRTTAFVLLLAACSGKEAPVVTKELVVRDAYAFVAKQGGTAAAYVVIRNGLDSAEVIDSVTSSVSRFASMHGQSTDNGFVTMVARDNAMIAAHDSLVLQPGGDHLMLEGVTRDLVAKDTLTVTFWFKHSGPRSAVATVREYGS